MSDIMDNKTVDEISKRVINKVSMMLLELMPNPSCPLRRQQNEWRRQQVIIDVKRKLDEKYNLNKEN
jgi:hypothetical protein